MVSSNVAGGRPALRFSVVPKSVPFEIERPNPEHRNDPTAPATVWVTLRAWDKTLPHPASVDIAVEAGLDVYREAIYEAEQADQARPGLIQTLPYEEASIALHANRLCCVIEGLEEEEANVLAAAGGPWQKILYALGWWLVDPDAPEADAETGAAIEDDGDDPEASAGGAPATTTGESSPASAPSTVPMRGAA